MNKFLNVVGILKPVLEAANVMEQVADACLDALEEVVKRSDNKVDDAVILPAIKGLRVIVGAAEEQQKEQAPNEA